MDIFPGFEENHILVVGYRKTEDTLQVTPNLRLMCQDCKEFDPNNNYIKLNIHYIMSMDEWRSAITNDQNICISCGCGIFFWFDIDECTYCRTVNVLK